MHNILILFVILVIIILWKPESSVHNAVQEKDMQTSAAAFQRQPLFSSGIWSVLRISWNLYWKSFLLLLLREVLILGVFVPDYLVWCFCRTKSRPYKVHRQHVAHLYSTYPVTVEAVAGESKLLCPLFSLFFLLGSQTHSPWMILGLQLCAKWVAAVGALKQDTASYALHWISYSSDKCAFLTRSLKQWWRPWAEINLTEYYKVVIKREWDAVMHGNLKSFKIKIFN